MDLAMPLAVVTSTWYGPGWSISPDWPGYRRSATAETLWASRHREAALSATNGIRTFEAADLDRMLMTRSSPTSAWGSSS